jgi:hypothetical protein
MKNAFFWDVMLRQFCKNRHPSLLIIFTLMMEATRSSENIGFYKSHMA